MEGSDSCRNRSIDAMGSWKECDEQEDADGRKSQPGKVTKHGYADRFEDPDDARWGSSSDRNESRRESVSGSAKAFSEDEDDYDLRRDSRVSKVPRRSPEEKKSEKDGDNSRRRREDENDWDSDQADGRPSSGQRLRVISRMHERLMTTGMDPVKKGMINIGLPNGKRKLRN